MAPLLLSWLGSSGVGEKSHTTDSFTCRLREVVHVRNAPLGSPRRCCMLQLGDGGGRLTGACGRCWGHVQFNEGRPGHMCAGMLTMLSLFTLCLVARCMQLMPMCFWNLSVQNTQTQSAQKVPAESTTASPGNFVFGTSWMQQYNLRLHACVHV